MKTEELDKKIGMPDIDTEWAKFEKEVMGTAKPSPKHTFLKSFTTKAAAIAGIIFLLGGAIASAVIVIQNNDSQPQAEKFEYKPLVEVIQQKHKGKETSFYIVHYCEGVWIQHEGEKGHIEEEYFQMAFRVAQTVMQIDGKPFTQKNLPRMRNSHLKKIELKRQDGKVMVNLITQLSGGIPSGVTGNAPRIQTLFLFPNGMLGIIDKKAKAGDWQHYSITDWDETPWGWSVRKEMERGCHRLGYKAYIYASTETPQKYIDRAVRMMDEMGIKDYELVKDLPIQHWTDQQYREWAQQQKQKHPQYDWRWLFDQLPESLDGTDLHDKWHIVKEVYGVK